MTIIFILITIAATGIVLIHYGKDIGIAFAGIAGMLLFISTVSIITNPIGVKADIKKFLATGVAIEAARKAGVAVENAAIQHKIIEANQWLAQQQYYNTTMFELWVPNAVDDLKPIR
jgi:ABC-type Fe3+-siderophore transport system permease subunit